MLCDKDYSENREKIPTIKGKLYPISTVSTKISK